MQAFEGKVAVITGAASGLGRAFAEQGAALGMRLVLADIDSDALADTAATLRAAGASDVLDQIVRDATRRELARMQQHLVALGRKGACEKVAGFLIDVAVHDGGGAIALNMSRQDIADYLGLTIETVSRSLTQLQQEAVLKAEGSRRFRVCRSSELERLAA